MKTVNEEPIPEKQAGCKAGAFPLAYVAPDLGTLYRSQKRFWLRRLNALRYGLWLAGVMST